MHYEDYIKLGFNRIDLADNVEFRLTGYYGYCLTKRINNKLSISVCNGELDEPNLYIKKRNSDTFHIIRITGEAVMDLLLKNTEKYKYKFTDAC